MGRDEKSLRFHAEFILSVSEQSSQRVTCKVMTKKKGKGTTGCHFDQGIVLIRTFPVMLATMLDI